MKTRSANLICSIRGCRNRNTNFFSLNGVMINTPNICDDCIKAAYLTRFSEVVTDEVAVDEAEETVDEAEETVDEGTEEKPIVRKRRKKE